VIRLAAWVALTMVAFAANSVLNRVALTGGDIGPAAFAGVRMLSGAVMLTLLVLGRDRRLPALGGGWDGPLTLVVYVVGFSFAYTVLDAGVGALILFGGVQVTMFAGAVVMREAIPLQRWAGAVMAMAGLIWLMWPGQAQVPSGVGTLGMLAAAIGWGLYSLIGRRAGDPLVATARNFILAAPLAVVVWLMWPDGIGPRGAMLACVSGAVTSGLGYALWYRVLPRLPAAVAAIAQLSVPVIAMAGGLAFLGETVGLRFVIASVLVITGVVVSLIRV